MHKCPVDGCPAELPQHILMCHVHWRILPFPLKRKVYEDWNNGIPTPDYPDTRQKAITAVNQRMGGRSPS